MHRRALLTVMVAILGAGAGGHALYRAAGGGHGHRLAMSEDFGDGEIYTSDSWFLSAHEVEQLGLEDARPLER